MYQEDRIWDKDLLQITSPQNQEENPDPHKPKVLLLGAPGNHESTGKDVLRNISEFEEPPQAP